MYTITDEVITNEDLNLNEKVVFSFLAEVGECNDTLKVMKEQTGVDSVGILRNTLKSLVSKGYIIMEIKYPNFPATYSVANTSDEDTFNKEDTAREFRHSGGNINPKKMLEEKRKHLQGGYNKRTLLD